MYLLLQKKPNSLEKKQEKQSKKRLTAKFDNLCIGFLKKY